MTCSQVRSNDMASARKIASRAKENKNVYNFCCLSNKINDLKIKTTKINTLK